MEAVAQRRHWRLLAAVPVVLLVAAVTLFSTVGDSLTDLVGKSPPPADEFDVRRVELHRGEVRIRVTNPQRDDLTIGTVAVDDAIVPYALDGPRTLGRLRSSTIVVPYDWVENEPLALGLLWLPSLRRARPEWLAAFMALTGGLLSFLAVEALAEALELQAALPGALGGPGLILLGVAGSYLTLTLLSNRLGGAGAGGVLGGAALATLVAIGIGLHNFGEGLAIGTSFALGELALGSFLIVGFMVHNVTEGLGIAT